MTLTEAKALVKTLLLTLPKCTSIQIKQGGWLPWLQKAGALQTHWEISTPAWSEEHYAGDTSENQVQVRIDGYMPFSYERPDSTEYWDALLEDIREVVRNRRGQSLSSDEVGPPQMSENALVFEEGALRPLCHHAAITFYVKSSYSYAT